MSVFQGNVNPTSSNSNQNFYLGKSITDYFKSAGNFSASTGQIFQSQYPLSMVNNFFSNREPNSSNSPLNRVSPDPSDHDVIFGNQSRDLYTGSALQQGSDNVPIDSAEPAIEETLAKGIPETNSISLSFETPAGMAGLGLSALDTTLTNSVNQSNLIAARQGNGPGGHAFDAVNHAEANANFNSINSSIQSALIAGGSAFGPEGLVAGVGLAGIEEGVSQIFSPSTNTTQGLSGDMVSDLDQ